MAGNFRTCKAFGRMTNNQIARVMVNKQMGSIQLMHGGRFLSTTSAQSSSSYGDHGGEIQPFPIKAEIGKREVVGYGSCGEDNYIDVIWAPFPAIRFKEDNDEILKLRVKEKGDWKKMTTAEKKELYRASFCQTLSEMDAPTGDWKGILGGVLTLVSIGLWAFIWVVTYGKRAKGSIIYILYPEGFVSARP